MLLNGNQGRLTSASQGTIMYLSTLLIVGSTSHVMVLSCSVWKSSALLEGSKASPACPCDKITTKMTMTVEQSRKDTKRKKRSTGKQTGRDSSVGIATRYGLEGPGSNPGGGEIFRTRPDLTWGPPSLLYNGYRVFPGGKAAGA